MSFSTDFIGRWQQAVAADATLAMLGRHCDVELCVQVDDDPWYLSIRAGQIIDTANGQLHMRQADLTITGPATSWDKFFSALPPRGFHDLFAMSSYRHIQILGNQQLLRDHLPFLKALFALPRTWSATPSPELLDAPGSVASGIGSPSPGTIEPVTGRYIHVPIDGQVCRIYFEEAGQGRPLVCLHTAGSHSTQFRHLLCDESVTSRFRVIAFDLPWHGKSNPPPGWSASQYKLSSDYYVEAIMAFCESMRLESPVIMGCSMGGRVVFRLAAEFGDRIGALIGLEATDRPTPWWDDSWLNSRQFASGEFCASLVSGLIAPHSPAQPREETLWHYTQGGSGIFEGDMHFFRTDSQFGDLTDRIDTNKCPLYLMTGEYDYSCRAENTQATADRIRGAKVTIMNELGHFPMSENPEKFRTYLLPVLEDILAATG